ncbi:HAMP domain-containing histidine kinase [bacterium]|nr:HAMP domain-containing histidine kinase [bacterium]
MSAITQDLPGLLGHELRNPLASALTGAMLARDMIDGDDPRAIVLDGVLRDLDRMTGLIDGWLQMARDQQDAADTVNIEEILSSVASRCRAEVVCAPPAFKVACNRFLLERVFENLCENARNAGATKVHFAAQHDGNRVDIHVEDDGRGIDPEDVASIFDAGCSGSGSTGLGLHAVATTVAAYRGEVRCIPLPRGTRFTISLPRAESNLA